MLVLVIRWCWFSNKTCNRCRLSSLWHGIFVWQWTWSGSSDSRQNQRRCCQARGDFHCNQVVEFGSWARKSGESLSSKQWKSWFGLHWFVFDALSSRIQGTYTIRILAIESGWSTWSCVNIFFLIVVLRKNIIFPIFSDVDYLDTWKAMEKLVDLGLAKSIGISNFNSQQVERLLANCRIKPVNNQVSELNFYLWVKIILLLPFLIFSINIKQIEVSPNINQKKLIKFCNDRDIVITAYCPLGRPLPAQKKPEFLFSDKLDAITKKYNKTNAQVVFRYLVNTFFSISHNNCFYLQKISFQIDIGTIPIPKSVTKKELKRTLMCLISN